MRFPQLGWPRATHDHSARGARRKLMTESARHGDPTEVRISPIGLDGILGLPRPAGGIVLFAHGSGSGRLSPRNNYVAAALRSARLATLLFDLLTEQEAADRSNVFDIELLAERLALATTWVAAQGATKSLRIGYFGASTGAAAALVAAARLQESIRAIVSRGGRPDMAAPVLHHVRAPTLLIVGGHDVGVLELNEQAFAQLQCEKRLEIVPGATHLFEEPGALDQVIDLAGQWFRRHLNGLSRPG
jgi:putative phosphoribosyl transferase